METHKENGLISILESFKGVREISDEHLKMKELDRQFHHMAKELLYGGYFLIEGKTRICLDDIEFYYHEEGEEGLKDPIMYHTNDHEGKEIPYFEIGRLNLHISGVDVTFENVEKKYRASFLIRGFHVENDEEPYNPCSTEIKNFDPCSTHIYDKMLYMGVPLSKSIEIEWVSKDLDGKETYKPKGEWRKNAAEFEINKNGKYIKKLVVGAFDENKHFHYGKNDYVRCQRPWRFKKENIKD